MPALTLLSGPSIVQIACAAVQAAASATGKVLDLSVGSLIRAIFEAESSISMWQQYEAVQVLNAARLSTCEGSDVDLFVGDFGLTRTAAVAATGHVTLSRYGSNFPALIPVGMAVLSSDGALTYYVTSDPTHGLWNAALNGYQVGIGVTDATVPVQAAAGGVASNIQSGGIALIASSIPGIDTVTNANPLSNGRDAETDDALKARFVQYIAGLSKATTAAVGAAITSVQPGLTYNIFANVDPSGNALPGHFVITVDDGSGDPPQTLLDAIYTAVDAVRAITETFNVQGPTIVQVVISMTITVAAGVNKAVAQGLVAEAITSYVDNLGVGAILPFNLVSKLAFDVLPSGQIVDVSSLTINGQFGDAATVDPGKSGVVRVSQVVVN